MVRGLIELGRALDLTVVAQGVESKAQVDALRALGCRYAQGPFLVGREMGPGDSSDPDPSPDPGVPSPDPDVTGGGRGRAGCGDRAGSRRRASSPRSIRVAVGAGHADHLSDPGHDAPVTALVGAE